MNNLDNIHFKVSDTIFEEVKNQLNNPLSQNKEVVKLLAEKAPWENN